MALTIFGSITWSLAGVINRWTFRWHSIICDRMEVIVGLEISSITYRFAVEEIIISTCTVSWTCRGNKFGRRLQFIFVLLPPSDLTTNVAATVSIKRFRMQIVNFTMISSMDRMKVWKHIQLEWIIKLIQTIAFNFVFTVKRNGFKQSKSLDNTIDK